MYVNIYYNELTAASLNLKFIKLLIGVLKLGEANNKENNVFISQYVKDISFENYAAQTLKFTNTDLTYNIDLNIKRKTVSPTILEVTLLFLMEALSRNKKQYVLEVAFAATFPFDPEKSLEEKKKFAFIECSSVMFPYLRQIVFNISRDSGFPPTNLGHIDFLKIFNNKKFP